MTTSFVKYPIGIQEFSEIRQGGYEYVDKTALIYKLINDGKYYFLSRPRRFGKSLLLNTIKAYFEGKKELFDGLAIAELEKEWNKTPVLMLSLARYNRSEQRSLNELLDTSFKNWEDEYNIKNKSATPSERFHNIVLAAYQQTGQKVAILIDEYDAPMVAHLGDDEKHTYVRDLLKSVYVNIKDLDGYIRFAMLTGVSRFSKTSIFSGLNNLNDITLDVDYAEICGITEDELLSNFKPGIAKLATELETDYDGAVAQLKFHYDGYHFARRSADIYNPFSLLTALQKSDLGSYWFASGTPTFLLETIHNTDHFLPKYFTEEAGEQTLSDIDTYRKSPLALMFQTGYLTIKGYDSFTRSYRLGLPNEEVRQGLSEGLLKVYMDQDGASTESVMLRIKRAFYEGQPEVALEHIKAFLANIPYELAKGKDEIYFENNLYLIFNLVGIDTAAEYHTSNGRIDLLVTMPKYVYVMELKLDGTPEQALAQINEKGYAAPFATDPRTLFKIGINFSHQTRNIDTWLIEK